MNNIIFTNIYIYILYKFQGISLPVFNRITGIIVSVLARVY